ncbi:MAG: aspartate carbamoyltransferase catalytic subunit [Rhodospirillales bacterium]|nr:aspartate carbamoyltransferase catalytic subunit [Rhodospirillales bacterium]MCB9996741.1 aspartate carbamoyltransferase catalytic subunit [Rhodospirillales bacterium]
MTAFAQQQVPMTKPFQKVDRSQFRHEHLIGIDQLSAEEIAIILDLADYYADRLDEKSFKPDILRGDIVLSLFFEDSTRTRTSFEVAAKRLGADWVNIDIDTSSVKKGESLLDTVMTLHAMLRPDAIIMRHKEYGAPEFIAKHVGCPVINAGDSWREHPTQALLDALTMMRNKGRLEGLNVAICGDIAHSRVASSNMILLTKMGANVRVIAPPVLMPEKFPAEGVTGYHDMNEGLKDCDIVMTIRLQKERIESGVIESTEAFFNEYRLTPERMAHARPDALIMDPGPIIRGEQISDELADDPDRSLILQQVRNGVPVRMAALDLLLKNR